MLCFSFALAAVGALSVIPASMGQLVYKADPSINWSARGEPVRQGNGVFLSPSEDIVVSSSNIGAVNAWDSLDGTKLWRYSPVAESGAVLSCSSGVTFIKTDSMESMFYTVVVNEFLSNPTRYATRWTVPFLLSTSVHDPVF
jgi:hypothetical protein